MTNNTPVFINHLTSFHDSETRPKSRGRFEIRDVRNAVLKDYFYVANALATVCIVIFFLFPVYLASMSLDKSSLGDIVAEEINNFEPRHVHEAIKLIENDNTIPFIARYRRVQTGGMDAETLRNLKMLYENLR